MGWRQPEAVIGLGEGIEYRAIAGREGLKGAVQAVAADDGGGWGTWWQLVLVVVWLARVDQECDACDHEEDQTIYHFQLLFYSLLDLQSPYAAVIHSILLDMEARV